MCRAIEQLIQEERAKEREAARLEFIPNLMETLGITCERAMSAMAIPEAEWSKYKELLANTEK